MRSVPFLWPYNSNAQPAMAWLHCTKLAHSVSTDRYTLKNRRLQERWNALKPSIRDEFRAAAKRRLTPRQQRSAHSVSMHLDPCPFFHTIPPYSNREKMVLSDVGAYDHMTVAAADRHKRGDDYAGQLLRDGYMG